MPVEKGRQFANFHADYQNRNKDQTLQQTVLGQPLREITNFRYNAHPQKQPCGGKPQAHPKEINRVTCARIRHRFFITFMGECVAVCFGFRLRDGRILRRFRRLRCWRVHRRLFLRDEDLRTLPLRINFRGTRIRRLRGGTARQHSTTNHQCRQETARTAAPFPPPSSLPLWILKRPGCLVPGAPRVCSTCLSSATSSVKRPAGASSIHTFLDARKRLWKAAELGENELGRWRCHRVCRLQTIISNGSGGGSADMNNRSPSFQLVVAGSMKDIGRTDRNSRARCFDRGKCCMIIYRIVGEKDLPPPAPPHVQRRKVVQRARS